MVDFDIYYTNPKVEMFLESLKIRFNKDYPTTKVYISTVGMGDHWLRKLYNNTELMEEQ